VNLFENRAGLKQFVKFCLIGALGVATNFSIFVALIEFDAHYVAASIVGWFIALVVVFALNRRFTFTSSGSTVGDFAKTLGVYSTQQLLVVAGLTVGVESAQPSATR
jgi:putative flippase GtrA